MENSQKHVVPTDLICRCVIEWGRTKLRIYKGFKERTTPAMRGAGSWALDAVHGGTLLGARGSGTVVFWDWTTGEIVRRIDADAKNVSKMSS